MRIVEDLISANADNLVLTENSDNIDRHNDIFFRRYINYVKE